MKIADIPGNEAQRLAALRSYDILDTDPELGFDDLTQVAAAICGTPIALVSLVDRDRQWFKSRHGLDVPETLRDVALCAHAIHGHDLFVVPDTLADDRFLDNPICAGAPHVRFYAGAPLVTDDGLALGTLCVIDHLPRQLDGRQRDALRRLGRQVICQLELRRARDEARRSARAKHEFLATMSHEIRTPLNGVIGSAELLAAAVHAPELQDLAQTISRSGRHLLGIVDDILDTSRLEAGGVHLAVDDFDLREVMHDVLAMCGTPARQKGIALELDWRVATPSRRRGDAYRLRQVLVNLVGNAVKFTHEGSVQLAVADGAAPEGLRIAVRDTGIGIREDVLPMLFQRFVQADSSTTRRFGGSGLGLSICRELVGLMGGEVAVQSIPGTGSTFSFELLLPVAMADASSQSALANVAGTAMDGSLARLSVLVVDDDPTNRKLLAMMLAQLGCEVSLSSDGADAVRACRDAHFDLVLMDSMMPGMDGYEATRLIRALDDDRAANVPIVAITASVMADERSRCESAGMNAFMGKPITRGALERVLPTVLVPSRSTAQNSH